jgi:hypothetical protein
MFRVIAVLIGAGLVVAGVIVLRTPHTAESPRTGGAPPTARARDAEQPYPISASLPAGVKRFLQIETSPGVFSVQYHYGHVDPAPNGAYLNNVTAPRSAWYIEDQRYGETDVIAGVLHDNVTLIRTGLKMVDFGLKREAPNGSFPGSLGLFHGTAMFLASASPAMLVLQSWNRLDTRMGTAYLKHLAWEKQRLRRAARYMVNTYWNKPGHIDDQGKEERFFEGAIALAATAALTGDKLLQDRSHAYARAGVRMTQSNGVWTENSVGGRCCHDSSYQGIGLKYGTRYLELLHSGPLFKKVYPAVSKGERWEISRVRSNGTIVTLGDTRTTGCSERDQTSGACKNVNLEAVFSSLMRWGVITDSSHFRTVALKVWALNAKRHGG